MKNLLVAVLALGAIGMSFVSWHLSQPMSCKTIDQYDDQTITCDGVLIQGHPHYPNVIIHEWKWLN